MRIKTVILICVFFISYILNAQYNNTLSLQPEKLSDENERQFVLAIANGDGKIAKEMVEKGVDPDCMVPTNLNKDITLLQFVVMKKNYHVMRFLVQLGADINRTYHFDSYFNGQFVQPASDQTLLMKEAQLGNWNMMDELMKNGALVTKKENGVSVFNYISYHKGYIKSIIKMYLFEQLRKEAFMAISNNKLNKLKEIVFEFEQDINDSIFSTKDKTYYSLIEYAVLSKKDEIARFLIKRGAKLDSSSGLSAFVQKNGQVELLRMLDSAMNKQIKCKKLPTKIELQAIKEKSEETLLVAYYTLDIDKLKLAIQNCLNRQYYDIIEKYYLKSINDKPDFFKIFYQSYKKPIGLPTAFSSGRLDIAKFLIENGADIDEVGEYYNAFASLTARFMFLVKDKRKLRENQHQELNEIKKLLPLMIKKGAEINNSTNGGKQTPLILTVSRFADKEEVSWLQGLLIKNKARLDIQDEDGYTALMLAIAKKGNSYYTKFTDFESVKRLVEAGADFKTLKNNRGQTAIEYAENLIEKVSKSEKKKFQSVYRYLKKKS